MTATESYIEILTGLKAGELGLLRKHAGQGLDETVDGFDLFAGLWWPLRQRNERAPRREVAWLVARLYGLCPVPQSPGDTLARQLGRCRPNEPQERERFEQRFDRLLALPVKKIEHGLRWALRVLVSRGRKLDWVRLTDDLSFWHRQSTRLRWAEDFLQTEERSQAC